MKKEKKYLKLYEEFINNGLPTFGLCTYLHGDKRFKLFEPKSVEEYPYFDSNGNVSNWFYWGGDGYTDGYDSARKFTALRQTIILFLAAMNDEL